MPIPAFTTTLQKTHIEMCRANIHGHTDSKCFLQSSIYEVVIQEWTFTISLPIFLFSDLCFYFYLKCFFRSTQCNSCCLIYPATRQNARLKKEKKIVFSSKVPLGEGSAAMGFQVCFKSVGFFAVIKGNCIFNTPRSKF